MGLYLPASLSTLAYARKAKRKRISSFDRTGGNDDRIYIQPGEQALVAEVEGAGCINHIWCTIGEGFPSAEPEENYLRKLVLRIYWDGETVPSVEAPIGDFFGMGHGICKNYVSAPLQMSPEDGRSFNCWFPMPFASGARITLTNEGSAVKVFYYYVDYEEFTELPGDLLRFHTSWNRECPTRGIDQGDMSNLEFCFTGQNTTGDENYVVLDAVGRGHYVGCNINIHNLRDSSKWDWPGEGDDMIFIDGEKWPPNIHGTGTEDYVNMAFCPTQEYSAPYHGLILGGRDNWKGMITYYRYHILDPIMFEKSIRVTIEHGHNNHRSDDWSSTAYWYQEEPHRTFKPLQQVEKRMPLKEKDLLW